MRRRLSVVAASALWGLAAFSFALPSASEARAASGGAVCEAPARKDACERVRRARALLGEGKPVEAAALLDEAARALPEIAPWLDALRARALLSTKDAAGARKLANGLRAKTKDAWLDEELALVIAESHRADGALAAEVEALRALLAKKYGDPTANRARLGEALLALGKPREGKRELTSVLVRDPGHPAARALEGRLDDGTLSLSLREQARRAEGLIKSSRFARAALEAVRALEGKPLKGEDAIELEVQAVTALVRAGRGDDALRRVAGYAEEGADPALLRLRAWTFGKTGRLEEAARAWRVLEEAARSADDRAEACFFSGFLLYEANETAKARARLEACAPVLEGTKWAVSGRWYRALLSLLENDIARAEVLLDELVKAAPRDREVLKHRYWLARARLESGDETKASGARALLEDIARDDPTGYYGLLARARLGKPPLAGARVTSDALARLAADDASAKRARLLHALGFDEAARSLAARRGRRLADLGLSQAIDDAHRPWRFGASLRPHPAVTKDRLAARAGWRASYATPYRSLVDEACRRHGLDASFAYAIMRTESGFSETARSVAGALGLLQLMPYTATGMATKLGKPPPEPEALTRPEVNIDLGVAFLALAEREFGHPLLAAAVYNGGPDNVARWLKDFGHLEPELFVERIPFLETRNYVKRVGETAALYRALDGAALDLQIPAKPFGAGPTSFTWFPPSGDATKPIEGAVAPGR